MQNLYLLRTDVLNCLFLASPTVRLRLRLFIDASDNPGFSLYLPFVFFVFFTVRMSVWLIYSGDLATLVMFNS